MDKLITRLNLTPSTDQNSGSQTGSDNRAATSLMAKLWERMIEMYGHKFTSSYGEVPSDTWTRALAGCSPQGIAQGIRACFQRQDPWPPTLPEFVEMCREQPRSLYFHSPMMLEHKTVSTPETAKKHIAEIKAKLRLNQ